MKTAYDFIVAEPLQVRGKRNNRITSNVFIISSLGFSQSKSRIPVGGDTLRYSEPMICSKISP
jgi:hypothetical protein